MLLASRGYGVASHRIGERDNHIGEVIDRVCLERVGEHEAGHCCLGWRTDPFVVARAVTSIRKGLKSRSLAAMEVSE